MSTRHFARLCDYLSAGRTFGLRSFMSLYLSAHFAPGGPDLFKNVQAIQKSSSVARPSLFLRS